MPTNDDALVERKCDTLNIILEEKCAKGDSFDIHHLYGQFTLETMLAVAFGSEVNLLKGEGSLLTEAVAGLFDDLSESIITWEEVFHSHFPSLLTFVSKIGARFLPLSRHLKYLNDTSIEIIKSRREQNDDEKCKDFLRLLMDASATDDDEDKTNSSQKKMALTDQQIAGLCLDFFVAGQETTANALAYSSYLLSLNPDEQERLCEAIDNYYQENEDASLYDASQNIPYLDWVIQEALRMYPPAPLTKRQCNKTCTINGITFPKGSLVIFPIQYLHCSPDNWDEPEVFNPNRFSPEGKEGRNPLSHIPFGWGPRSCIGMRFALMEAKACLVSILRKYRFERSPDTQVPLQLKFSLTQSPKNGIFLKLIKV
ncbi:PREDICTED: cytochrome P450 3A19-like [Amphimedon queenslandica]|uniref:Cytochrome P450 n=1 Tax=Amphimedon queenslandica TaxID=400682 RepID=A0AAN0J6G8_AMPQE|nr:PREDICTED: cytochrome P450 3A19-like [Amphimedon queenslandica]|eukprot:XP_019852635.1 PREDICTED: cytochrome P450 3A19-like [Amphimedon queenslandica]